MKAFNWDPSKSLNGPWNEPADNFRASGNSRQRRKARRKLGWRASIICKKHGIRHDPEEYMGCSKCIEEYTDEESRVFEPDLDISLPF